jgi:L-seryl-tRNA(Ser) seleniumtransferase
MSEDGQPAGASAEDRPSRLRSLPSVDRLAAQLDGLAPSDAVAVARGVLAERRQELLAGAEDEADLLARALSRARARVTPSLRRVLNGTGVVIHTNLGRVPLAAEAVRAVEEASRGYANLEMEMATGRRGSREEHVRDLLVELTGGEDAMAVNNGAAAILLAVAALVGAGGRVAVSRGQLVEIGGGFRVPDIVAQAGAGLIEVGTTNRTRPDDYRTAIEMDAVDALLRVHQSNFRTVGFVQEVEIERLCEMGLPVIDDVGSGALADGLAQLAGEPQVGRSVAAGAALVCFSGDKLLGGPQAGILVGRGEAIAACRRHPLARALRIGRLPLAGLATTLALYRDPERARREIPVLAMLDADRRTLAARAERLASGCGGEVVQAVARVGGGALPLLELDGPAVALDPPGGDADGLARALREGDPPLVPRIAEGRVLVDPRTLAEEEVDVAAAVIRSARAVGRPCTWDRRPTGSRP